MLIANPIYDVVFKYLMKDEKVAKLLLSAILGREVIELEFRPTEQSIPLGHALTVMRLDFSARIQEADGSQQLVILELQKAKLTTDIMRFRKYLGSQYSNENNVVREPEAGGIYGKALPIISIYFLGNPLEHTKAPVVRVNRLYIDVATGEEIKEKEEFIESLTHDSIIIQIPYLSGKRRTELEKLLAIFDQSAISYDRHFLDIDEEELPGRYRPLLRRLQKAMVDAELKNYMDAEDDVVAEYQDMQRQLNLKDKLMAQKEADLMKKDAEILRRDATLSEKDAALSEKDAALSEKEKQLQSAIKVLFETGLSAQQISATLGLTATEVERVLKN